MIAGGPEIRPRLEEIQEEMYEALAAYTFEGAALNPRFDGAERNLGAAAALAPQNELAALSADFRGLAKRSEDRSQRVIALIEADAARTKRWHRFAAYVREEQEMIQQAEAWVRRDLAPSSDERRGRTIAEVEYAAEVLTSVRKHLPQWDRISERWDALSEEMLTFLENEITGEQEAPKS